MKLSRPRTLATFFVSILSLSLSQKSHGQTRHVKSPPFKHAMIFSGGDLDYFTFFGMYHAAIDAGNPPDLIIGTCGGALASAIVKTFPNPTDLQNFIYSKKFYDYMRDVKFTDMALWKLIRSLKTVAKDAQHQAGPYRGMRTIPNPFFKPNIMSPENNYDYPEIQRGFHSDEGPEIAIFANKIRYDQSQVGKWVSQQEKLYTEFVFTSRYVKEKIDQHLDMNQHETSEGSFISSETVVVTDKSLNFAARSSFTDPFYIPVEQPFLTGAVNIMSAYELAKLGREVTARYAGQWEEIGGGIVTKFFALDPWKLYEDYTSLYADRWVDNSIEDYKEVTMKVKMSPTLRSIPSLGIRLKSNVPQHNHRKFKKAVRSQYEFGYQQYMIANKAPRNSKNHISKRHDRDLPMAELKSARENSASYYWSKDKKTASSN